MTIPVTNNRVDLDLLHPKFKERLEAFFADANIAGRVKVVSGCRSYAQQKYFYDKYKSGKGNLAANPDRRFGKGNFWRGSWHMQQEDGHCYAVDFRITGKGISTWEVNNIAKTYGLYPTVSSEWWHHQPRNGSGWFDAPALSQVGDKIKTESVDLAGIAKYIAALGAEVAKSPLRRKSRGNAVKAAQRRLGDLGFDCGIADGIFGRKTTSGVKKFQRVEKISRDGVIGSGTWERLWNPQHA